MATLFDLHVHTSKGSSDSSLSPEDMVQEAARLGLRGLCVTEHSGPWDRHQFQEFSAQYNLALVRGMEVETDMGHILAYGLDTYVSGIHKAEELRKELNRLGGFMISAHPFRHLYSSRPLSKPLLYLETSLPTTAEEAAHHPVFGLVDAIEVANGATVDRENDFAVQVTQILGSKSTGGSDAHSTQALGRCITVFEADITAEEQFYNAFRAGAFYPAILLPSGQWKHLAPEGTSSIGSDS